MKLPFEEFLPVGICGFSDIQNRLIRCRAMARLPENPQSIIVYLFPYYLGADAYKGSNLSKYAVVQDYHKIAGAYLERAAAALGERFPGFEFEPFADNSPIPEVLAATLAGLGVKGENGLLINEKYGSFVFIGEIVTDMKLEPSMASTGNCLNCGACIKKCRGAALSENGFEKERCLSHLTQLKGELSASAKEYIKESGIIWGCDFCQDACPMNRNIAITPIPEFFENVKKSYEEGDSLESRAFGWRGEAVINRNLKIKYCKDEENKL